MTNGTSTVRRRCATAHEHERARLSRAAYERDACGERDHEEQRRIDGHRPDRARDLWKELEAEERRVVRRVVDVDHEERARARLQKEPRHDHRERKARVEKEDVLAEA